MNSIRLKHPAHSQTPSLPQRAHSMGNIKSKKNALNFTAFFLKFILFEDININQISPQQNNIAVLIKIFPLLLTHSNIKAQMSNQIQMTKY